MENQNIINGIENQENRRQSNVSNIENFLQGITNKVLIQNSLNKYNLTNDFESYLSNVSKAKEIQLKNKLKNCDNEEDIYSIMIEFIYEKKGYQIGYHEISDKKLTDNQVNELEKQNTELEKQNTELEKQNTELEKQNTELEGQTTTNENESLNIISGREKMNKAIATRQELIGKPEYEGLNEKTKEGSENYEKVAAELSNKGIIDQLKQSNHDDEFIRNYILVQTTLVELKSNPDGKYRKEDILRFDKLVMDINNSCKIPDTTLDSFSNKNIGQTRKELFNNYIGNTNLIKQKNRNIKSHSSEYEKQFDVKGDKELIENYGKFLGDYEGKQLYEQRADKQLTPEDNKEQYDSLVKRIRAKYEEIKDFSQQATEELCLSAQIKGILRCIPKKYADNFQLNKAKEINMENGILEVQGHINGIDFSMKQNTNDTAARLQTSTIISKEKETINLGKNYEDSPFKFPTQKNVFDIAFPCIDLAITDAQNFDDYKKILQEKIMDRMDKLYEDTKFTNHYIEDKIKGEEISNNTFRLLESIKGGKIDGILDEGNRLFHFIDLMKFNIEHAPIDKKERIFSCINKINNIINEYGKTDKTIGNNYPPIIRHYLIDKKCIENSKKILNNQFSSGKPFRNLFEHYTTTNQLNDGKLKIINFDLLENDLSKPNGNQSYIAAEWEAKEFAEANLENQINNLV